MIAVQINCSSPYNWHSPALAGSALITSTAHQLQPLQNRIKILRINGFRKIVQRYRTPDCPFPLKLPLFPGSTPSGSLMFRP